MLPHRWKPSQFAEQSLGPLRRIRDVSDSPPRNKLRRASSKEQAFLLNINRSKRMLLLLV
jgi:hypothetical protein